MPRVDSTQQLAFIESEGKRVIGLTRSGLPRGFLPGEHDREAIQVGDHAAIDGFLKGKQSRLMREQLADGDLLFPLLRELGPVPGHPLFVIEPAPRVREGERHRGQTLRGRVDDHHRVLLPGLAGLLVADAAPQIDDLLAAVIDTTGATELTPSVRSFQRTPRDRLEATTDVTVDLRQF